MGESHLLIASGRSLQKTGDQLHPFHVDKNFFAWTGMDIEDAVVLIVLDETQKAVNHILFFDEPDEKRCLWESIKWDTEKIRRFGFAGDILPKKQLNAHLKDIPGESILLPSESSDSTREMYATIRRRIRQNGYTEDIQSADDVLERKRVIKTPEDIAKIQRAIQVTNEIYDQVKKKVQSKEFTTEREVQAFIAGEFIRHGGREAFDTIVASGANACTLHYTANDGELKDGDLLLIDFGIELDEYGADISRTFPISGTFTERQQVLYDAVLNIKEFAEKTLKPGITVYAWNTLVVGHVDRICQKIGFKPAGGVQKHPNMPHLIGHFLGLDTHDVGNYKAIIEPGMVFTIEPGLYIPAEKIGIRVENNYLVTQDGCKQL